MRKTFINSVPQQWLLNSAGAPPNQEDAKIEFSLEPVVALSAVETLWRKLEAAGDNSFFVSWTWIGTWLRCLPEAVKPLLLTASRDGETVGAAILIERIQRRRFVVHVRQLHFNATGLPELDCITIEHNGFAGDSSPGLWPAFLEWFARESGADELVVPGMADGAIADMQGRMTLLHDVFKMPGFASALIFRDVEGVLGELSSNTRQQLRRNLRALHQMGELRCEAASTPGEAFETLAALKELHIGSWGARGKPHAFRWPFFEQFHRALIFEGLSKGSVQLLRVSAGTVILGYLYNFRHRDREYAYQSGFDKSKSRLRPGYVSHLLAMTKSASVGETSYDFLAGDNRLKRTFGRKMYEMHWHRFSKPTFGLRLEMAARSAIRKLKVGRKRVAF